MDLSCKEKVTNNQELFEFVIISFILLIKGWN